MCAVFNPPIPDKEPPSYLNLSRPVDNVRSDQSMEALFKGIGDVFSQGAKAADFLTKESLSKGIRDTLYPLRDEFIGQLDATKAKLQASGAKMSDGGTEADPLRPDDPYSAYGQADEPTLVDKEPAPKPADLDTLPKTLEVLQSARANGKLSPTDYLGRLATIAKNFRARYPGYRDFIDREVASITGVDPANAYIRSVLGDINSYVGGTNAEKNRNIAWIRQHFGKIQDAPVWLELYRQDKIPINVVEQKIYARLKTEADFQHNEAILKDWKGNLDKKKIEATQAAVSYATDIMAQNLETVTIGAEGRKLVDTVQDYQSGKIPENAISAENWVRAQELMIANRDAAKLALKRKLAPHIATIGDKEVNQIIDNAAEGHEMVIKAIGVKQPGTALMASNLTKAANDEGVRTVTQRDHVLRMMGIFNAIGGPDFAAQAYLSAIRSKMTPQDMDRFVTMLHKLGVQPDIRTGDFSFDGTVTAPHTPSGQAYTLSKALDDVEKIAKAEGKPVDQALVSKIAETPQNILNPKAGDRAKLGFAIAAFDPTNTNFISRIKERHKTFKTYTSDAMTKEIDRLDKVFPDIGLSKMYENWMHNTFKNELFSRDIKDFRANQVNADTEVAWDTDFKNFKVSLKPMPAPTPQTAPYLAEVIKNRREHFARLDRTVQNLNEGLEPLANYAKSRGTDVEAYILRTLVGLGVDMRNVKGLPENMMKAIIKSREEQEKKQ